MAQSAETLRSRLYRLEVVNGEETWVERGEGYPEFKRQDSLFRLRYYSVPSREVLYDVIVDTNIQFQRAENGVQWTQVKQNQVLALSFKEAFSANAFWQLIEDYQRKYAISVPAADGIYFYFEYKVPDPSVSNLPQVLQQLQNIPQKQRHERVASIFLTKRDLLPRLLNVFKKIEQDPQRQKLQILFQILKIMFNASNQELYYEILCNESFSGVLGILEYDPNFKNCQPKHRQFMGDCRLMEVVPFKSNPELLNLVVFTYRLEYIRECVLFPYLDDNGFGSSGCIIRNNYKKIFNQIFNPKRKQFINSLFDLLRLQDIGAFKLLRQLFRIAHIHYMPEIFQLIAERDTFQIIIRCLKDLLVPSDNQAQNGARKKKKKPEELQQIVGVCLQIIQQYMEHYPQHFRDYLNSVGQKMTNYPTFQFLLEQFQQAPHHISSRLGNIMKVIMGVDGHPIKQQFRQRIMQTFLALTQVSDIINWLPIFSQILQPSNIIITQRLKDLTQILIKTLKMGSKGRQVYHISVFKVFMHTYITNQIQIQSLLIPQAPAFADLLMMNKNGDGIRVSGILALFVPQHYHNIAKEIARNLQGREESSSLAVRYTNMLDRLSERKEVILPKTLKRDCLDRVLDEQNFDKLSKKIKID